MQSHLQSFKFHGITCDRIKLDVVTWESKKSFEILLFLDCIKGFIKSVLPCRLIGFLLSIRNRSTPLRCHSQFRDWPGPLPRLQPKAYFHTRSKDSSDTNSVLRYLENRFLSSGRQVIGPSSSFLVVTRGRSPLRKVTVPPFHRDAFFGDARSVLQTVVSRHHSFCSVLPGRWRSSIPSPPTNAVHRCPQSTASPFLRHG